MLARSRSWTNGTAIIVGACLCFVIGCASAPPHRSFPTAFSARHVPGELIVKLRPAAGEVLKTVLAAGHPATQTTLPWLDTLNRRFGVTRIEPLLHQHADPEELARKYPQRARRAPAGTPVPSLRHVYKLMLPPEADISEAIAAYSAQPDIEYAHPNYLVTVQ